MNSRLPPHPATFSGKMPWWKKELWALRHQLRRAYQARRYFPSVANIESYRNLKSAYQKRLRQCKTESWKEFCSNNLNGDLFGSLKKIAGDSTGLCPPLIKIDGSNCTDPSKMLNAFSTAFFPALPPLTTSSLVLETEVRQNVDEPLPSLPFDAITSAEVRSAIDSLKANQSPGTDGCSADWLKLCSPYISQHISGLFNACLASSYFPSDWRIAKVLILRKINKPHYDDPGCYRPISILCALSKTFERILHSRLKSASDSLPGSWFNNNQHGFRVGRSTDSAGSTLVGLIEKNLNKKLSTCCAFLDIKGAFDSAWHPAILRGLLNKGCPLYLVKIIRSFLDSRKAELSCSGITLQTETALGCPQGSILSPFLWNILVDSLLDADFPFGYQIIAYADDLVLCTWHADPESARRNLQNMTDYAVTWGTTSMLTFNAAKTVFMVFSRRRRTNSIPLSITVNNTIIEPSRTCTYLGLVLDDKLIWRDHIKYKCTSTKRLLFIVNKCCRLTWGLSRDKLITIYKSIFLPKLLYGCVVWGGALRHTWCRKLLRATQRQFSLTISRSFKTNSTLSALILANIPPIDYVVKNRICTKALLTNDFHLTPSSSALVSDIVDSIRSLTLPPNCTPNQFMRCAINKLDLSWNDEWVTSSVASHTRSFFPTVTHAAMLATKRPTAATVQVLTGHSMLNGYLAKIKKRESEICNCGDGEETSYHFLFHCKLFHPARASFKSAVLHNNMPWPPDPSQIPQCTEVWQAMTDFIEQSCRFSQMRVCP